jgi:rhamnosyltransferase
MNPSLCAIVVTYHPDVEFAGRLGRILPQVGALIIVDNGSSEATIPMLRECAKDPRVTLILNGENFGIARALNIGIQSAVARAFEWVLLLDQDSVVDADLVTHLFAVHAEFPHKEQLAVIGAAFRDVNLAPEEPEGGDRRPWTEVELVITSGSLIPLANHARVGPFREEFFIDCVDIDYCGRARARGLLVIKTRRTLMTHAIGASTRHNVLWMHKWTTNHSADRRYYFARNGTVTLREYGNYAFGLWALKSFSRCFRLCKRIALYEEMKTRKILAVAHGWFDGVRGRLGPRTRRPS